MNSTHKYNHQCSESFWKNIRPDRPVTTCLPCPVTTSSGRPQWRGPMYLWPLPMRIVPVPWAMAALTELLMETSLNGASSVEISPEIICFFVVSQVDLKFFSLLLSHGGIEKCHGKFHLKHTKQMTFIRNMMWWRTLKLSQKRIMLFMGFAFRIITIWLFNIAMENHHFLWENSLWMAIFHSYVELPEGIAHIHEHLANWSALHAATNSQPVWGTPTLLANSRSWTGDLCRLRSPEQWPPQVAAGISSSNRTKMILTQ